MKTTVAVILAVALGAVAGAFVVHHRLEPQLREAQSARDTLERQASQSAHDAQRANDRLAALEPKLDALLAERDSLREQLKTAPPPVSGMAEEEVVPEDAADAAVLSEPEQPEPTQRPDRTTEGQRPDERAEDRRGSPWRDPEARRQFMNDMRERSQGYLQDRIAATRDPVAQERLRSIGEYTDYLMELGSQMADAESDEEREQLRQTMDETRESLQSLVRDQQEYMARDLAAQYGITDEDKQDAFISSLSELRDSPFFNSRLMQGGGRGRGGPPFMGGGPSGEASESRQP